MPLHNPLQSHGIDERYETFLLPPTALEAKAHLLRFRRQMECYFVHPVPPGSLHVLQTRVTSIECGAVMYIYKWTNRKGNTSLGREFILQSHMCMK